MLTRRAAMIMAGLIAESALLRPAFLRSVEAAGEEQIFLTGVVRTEAQAIRFADIVSENENRTIKMMVEIPQFEDGIVEVVSEPGFVMSVNGEFSFKGGTIVYNTSLVSDKVSPGGDGVFRFDGFFGVSEGFRMRGGGGCVLSRVPRDQEELYAARPMRKIVIEG